MEREIDYERLGNNIKETRKQSGLTQQSLAEQVSCNTSHISNIENNYTKVSLNTLLAIANSLHTSIDYLLKDQYENPSLAIDNELFLEISKMDDEKKEQLLRIIKVL